MADRGIWGRRTAILGVVVGLGLGGVRPGRAEKAGKASASVDLLGRIAQVGNRVVRHTRWIQTWGRAVEAGTSPGTVSLEDSALLDLGSDLDSRRDEIESEIRALIEESKAFPWPPGREATGAEQQKNLARLGESLAKVHGVVAIFRLKLTSRMRR